MVFQSVRKNCPLKRGMLIMILRITLFLSLALIASKAAIAADIPEEIHADDPQVSEIMLASTITAFCQMEILFSSLGPVSSVTDKQKLRELIGIGERVVYYFSRMRDYRLSPICCLGFLMDEGGICGGCLYKQKKFFTLPEVRKVRAQIKAMRIRLRELESSDS
jgi:hypothetical protein